MNTHFSGAESSYYCPLVHRGRPRGRCLGYHLLGLSQGCLASCPFPTPSPLPRAALLPGFSLPNQLVTCQEEILGSPQQSAYSEPVINLINTRVYYSHHQCSALLRTIKNQEGRHYPVLQPPTWHCLPLGLQKVKSLSSAPEHTGNEMSMWNPCS